MLSRVLVAVLTLVGPMPFRVCTCAARHPAPTPTREVAPVRTPNKSCRCTHCTPVKAVAVSRTVSEQRVLESVRPGESAPANGHERDCPAANPSSPVRDAATTKAPEPPTESAPAETLAAVAPSLSPTPRAFTTPPGRHCAPGIPLYLAFLSLRN